MDGFKYTVMFLSQGPMFRFHVNFWECRYRYLRSLLAKWSLATYLTAWCCFGFNAFFVYICNPSRKCSSIMCKCVFSVEKLNIIMSTNGCYNCRSTPPLIISKAALLQQWKDCNKNSPSYVRVESNWVKQDTTQRACQMIQRFCCQLIP